MSNKSLEQYKECYSIYVKHMTVLHNYHQSFIENVGKQTGENVRTAMSGMIKMEKQMIILSRQAWKEKLETEQEKRKKFRELTKLSKRTKNPPGRPKGRKNGLIYKQPKDPI